MKKKPTKVFSGIFKSLDLKGLKESQPKVGVLRHKKIEVGAKDFASRFEGVMRELSNG